MPDLRYTREKPTVPGWYIRRHNALPLGRELVMVAAAPSGAGDLVAFHTDGTDHYLADLAGEWAGPIPEPVE